MTARKNIPLSSVLSTLPVTFRKALELINDNTLGIIFFVDDNQKLLGALTDGDVRRDILAGAELDDLIESGSRHYNKTPKSLPVDCSIADIWKTFEQEVRCIPLVDASHRVVDYSTRSRVRQFMVSQPDIGEQEISNVVECITTGWISSQGRFIGMFENAFSEYLGGGHCLAVSNGTVALQLALTTLGIGAGDEVIVPDFTFGASINAIIHAGATPVLADVDAETWTLDLKDVQKRLTPKTKAIMPVHIYGQPAHMDEIMKIAADNGLLVIEDCAEALGATYKNKRVGLHGDATCFSFFANKSITTGEGGMVVFKDPAAAAKSRVLRDHGMNPAKKYWHDFVGFNFRMTNMQAAIGVAQMGRIDELLKRKKLLFTAYDSYFSQAAGVSLLPKNDWSENSYWLYTLMLMGYDDSVRDRLIAGLGFRGIDARPGFYPMHQMKPYLGYARGDYPVASHLSSKSISLPSSFGLSSDEIIHIATTFLDELAKFEREPTHA